MQGVIFTLYALISNRFLLHRVKGKFGSKFMQQRWLRAPVALFQAGLMTYMTNIALIRTIYLNDLKDLNMEHYFELDLDADMMR